MLLGDDVGPRHGLHVEELVPDVHQPPVPRLELPLLLRRQPGEHRDDLVQGEPAPDVPHLGHERLAEREAPALGPLPEDLVVVDDDVLADLDAGVLEPLDDPGPDYLGDERLEQVARDDDDVEQDHSHADDRHEPRHRQELSKERSTHLNQYS